MQLQEKNICICPCDQIFNLWVLKWFSFWRLSIHRDDVHEFRNKQHQCTHIILTIFCQLWPKRLVLYSCLCWCLVFPACRAVQGPGCRGWWRNHNCRGYRRQSAGCCWQTAHKRWEPDHFSSSNSRLNDSHCKDKIIVGPSFVYTVKPLI